MNQPMNQQVTWRAWAAVGAALAAYIAAGFWLANNDTAEEWIYKIGLIIASVVPLAFSGIYTAFGLSSTKPDAKWWRTPLGSALVIAALSLIPITWPLAWVFWMDGGNLRQSWLAWVEVSGPCISSLAWLWVCWLWLRVRAAERASRSES